jgi:predicted nucleotidyltransferase
MRAAVQNVVSELRERLEDIYGDRLCHMLLYGSEARGDAVSGSDVDVLVVLEGEVSPCEEIGRTSEVVAALSLRHGVTIVCTFVPESRYHRERSPLLMNVRREGVPV